MSDNKIGWLHTQESDLFIMSMITDSIGLHKVLLPIYLKNYNLQIKNFQKLCSKFTKYFPKIYNKFSKSTIFCWVKLQLWMWLAYWTVQ